MINEVQSGKTFHVVADRDYSGGDPVIINDMLLGIAFVDVKSGDRFAVQSFGIFEYENDGAESYKVAFYKDGKVSSDQNKGIPIGQVLEVEGNRAKVRIMPELSSVQKIVSKPKPPKPE